MQQSFTIMMVTQGAMSLDDCLDLPDADRGWLYHRCLEHLEHLEEQADKAKPRRGR